jgi:RHS repeat-associated protein
MKLQSHDRNFAAVQMFKLPLFLGVLLLALLPETQAQPFFIQETMANNGRCPLQNIYIHWYGGPPPPPVGGPCAGLWACEPLPTPAGNATLVPGQSATILIGFPAAPCNFYADGNSGCDGSYYSSYPWMLPLDRSGSLLTVLNPGGSIIDDASDGGMSLFTPSPCGMPVWSVSEPYISLWLLDEPLGYQPALGSRVSFKLSFKQREYMAGYPSYFFSVGKKWNCSWMSYVRKDGSSNNVVFFPGGMERTFYTTNDYLTNTRLTGDTTNGFILSYPDGSQNIYSFVVTNSSNVFQEAFLTQQINPQGQKTVLSYYNYNSAAPVVRLQNIVDGDGRTNSVYYATNNTYSTNLISKVVDPFNRSTFLAYDALGRLINIVDVAGITNSIGYDTNDVPTNLVTPYGTTSFSVTDYTTNSPPSGRSVLVTQPDGSHQLYLYQDNAAGISNTYPSSVIPSTGSYGNTFDTTNLNLRDTFYWGPRQYTNLSTTVISNLTAADFLKARMRHWLTGTNSYVGNTLSMERDPSPATNGLVEGQKTWFDYAGKTNVQFEGTQAEPLYVARVLPDTTTWFTRTDRNALGAVTTNVSTYSASSGVAFRTSIYVYDPNQIDLLMTTNALGVQVSSSIYNTNHLVTTNYDALNERTVYTYNTNQQLSSVTMPNGLVTTYIYGPDNFLATNIEVGYAINSYTYTNDLVFTHIDARGLSTTNTWDNLSRLVSTVFPDGTYLSNRYTILDLTGTKDRLGNWTSFVYDNMRRNTAVTNALGAVTIFNYCSCGALESIMDAATNLTQYFYDNQGNLTNTLYADGYSVTNNYNLLGQVVSTIDSGGNGITNTYNNQGLLTAINNAFGQVQSTTYDILDRVSTNIDANGVSVATTYDNLNRPLNRSYPDGGVEHWGYTPNIPGATSYTNQTSNVVTYTFDGLGRQTTNTVLGVTTTIYTYDGVGDRLTLTDGKNQTTTWTYDAYGNVSNKVDATNNLIFVYLYDADNRLTNRWTPAKGTTLYRYDNGGNLTNVDYSGGTVSMSSVYLAYDVLNRLTSMTNAVGTTTYNYDSVGELLSESGPWPNDAVSYTYTNRLRTGLSLSQPGGSWSQSYGYDVTRRMTNINSSAGGFGYVYPPANFQLPVSILLPNGARITNAYDSMTRELFTKLINSSGTVLDSESYGYNQASQRTTETNTAGDFRNYTYDNAGDLTTATGMEAGGTTNRWQEQLGYTYDASGNLNYRTNNGFLETFNVNVLNELSSLRRSGPLTVTGTTTSPATNVTVNGSNAILYADATFAATNMPIVNGSNTFTAVAQDGYGRVSSNTVTTWLAVVPTYIYDLNGNLLQEQNPGGTITNRIFAYDDENQLIAVWGNTWSNSFVYDGKFRRRIEIDFAWQGGAWVQTNEVHFIYDGNVVIQERNASNNPLVTYTRSGSSLLARTDYGQEIPGSPTTAYYHTDGNANMMMLIYSNQIIAAKYLYDPFGNTLSQSGPLASVNVYRFASKEWNNNAGIYYFVRRYYDPALQRFINRDPIQEQGGINLYTYCGNDPLDLIDPLGLCGGFWGTFWNGVGNDFAGIGHRAWELALEGDDIVGYGEASLFGYGQDFQGYSALFQNMYNNPTAYDPNQMEANIIEGTYNAMANVATLGLLGTGEGIYRAATVGDYSSLQDNFAWMLAGASAYKAFGPADSAAANAVETETLGSRVATAYQQFYNEAWQQTTRKFVAGDIEVSPGQNLRTVLGQETDAAARTAMKDWIEREGLSDQVLINKRYYDPSGSGMYRIPDVQIPSENLILEGTIGTKSANTPQIRNLTDWSGRAPRIITPTITPLP